MEVNEIENILNQLKENEISEYRVSKEDFFTFQPVLLKRDDFKHFAGNAQRGGDIIFTYLAEERS